MSAIDPKLFATGVGAFTGGYLLSTDNDVMGIAAGAAIGGATGLMMEYSTPENLDALVQKASKNTVKVFDPENIKTSKTKTFEERKEILRSAAERRAKVSKGTVDFDINKPFSSLNSNSLARFNHYLDNIKSIETLVDLETMFKSRSDDIFVSGPKSNSTAIYYKGEGIKVRAGAPNAEKLAAFAEGLVEMGYVRDSPQFKEKVRKFAPMLRETEGSFRIEDGKLHLHDTNTKINLTTINRTANGDAVLQHVSGKQVYNVSQVNLMGLTAISSDQTTAMKAVADALGPEMAKLFNLNAAMQEVAGLAPDDAMALMYNKLKDNPEALKKFEEFVNGRGTHDYRASQELLQNLGKGKRGRDALPTATINGSKISNTVDHTYSINVNEHGWLNPDKFLIKTGTLAEGGIIQSDMKRITKHYGLAQLTHGGGTKADHITDLQSTNKLVMDSTGNFISIPNNADQAFNIHTAYERNALNVHSRPEIYTDAKSGTNTVEDVADALLKKYGNEVQHSSANNVITKPLKADKEIVTGLSFNNYAADILGTDVAVADGQGLMRIERAADFTYESQTRLSLSQNAKGQIILTDAPMRAYINEEITYDEFKARADKGFHKLDRQTYGNLKATQKKLLSLDTLLKDKTKTVEQIFEEVGKTHTNLFKKYPSLEEFKSNFKASSDSEVLAAIEKKARKRILRQAKASEGMKRSVQDPTLPDATKAARSSILSDIDSLHGISASKRTTEDVLKTLENLIQKGSSTKEDNAFFRSFYPKAGHRYGYDANGAPIEMGKSLNSNSFQNHVWTVNSNGTKELDLLFKGSINLGAQQEIKTHGESSKSQLKMIKSSTFDKLAYLNDNMENIRYDSSKGISTLNLGDAYGSIDVTNEEMRTKSWKEIFADKGVKDGDKLAQEIADRYKNVGTLVEEDSSGLKTKARLMDAFTGKLKDTTGAVLSVEDGIEAVVGDNKHLTQFLKDSITPTTSTKDLHGLANFVLATSKDKTSTDFLVTALSNYKYKAAQVLQDDSLTGAQKIAKLETDFNILPKSNSSFDYDYYKQEIDSTIDDVMNYYSDVKDARKNAYQLLTDQATMSRVSSLFKTEANLRQDYEQDTIIRAHSWSKTAMGEAGSGSTDKSMSWNARLNLKMNGYTDKQLGLFVNTSSKLIADSAAIETFTRDVRGVTDITSQVSDLKGKQALTNALKQPPIMRRETLSKAGINIEGDVGSYKLHTKNELGIVNLPVILENTQLFDSYNDERGIEQVRKFNSRISEVIAADLSIRSGNLSEQEVESATHVINKNLEVLNSEVKDFLGGRGNLAKQILTSEAPRSRYSLSQAIGGTWIEKQFGVEKDGIAVVSSEGLLKRLQDIGGDIGKHKTIESLEEAGHLKPIGEGRFEVFYDTGHKVPMFSLTTREPAIGIGSTQSLKYVVDTGIESDKDGKVLHTHADNPRLKYYQLLDFDFDHQIEIFPKVNKNNLQELEETYEHGKKMNQTFDDLMDFVKVLGVKGKNKNKIATFGDLIDNSVDENKFQELFLRDTMTSRIKSGDRKIISPTVTKLASDLTDSVMQGDGSDIIKARARMMSHYFVENLIKSQHISNETYSAKNITAAEELAHHLYNGDKTRFVEKFGNYIEEELIRNLKVDDAAKKAKIEKELRETYKYIQDSIQASSTIGNADITPMHLTNFKKTLLSEATDSYRAVVEGTNAYMSPGPILDEQIVEEADMGIVQKGKMQYHRASEIIKHNVTNNKTLLLGAGAAMVGAALLTQSKPEFSNRKPQANPSGMLLDPARETLREQKAQQGFMGGLNRATEYITPYSSGQKNIQVDGEYYNSGSGELGRDINNAIFGDGMSSVRILM